MERISRSVEETRLLGMEIGKELQKGDIVLLQGNLGAGKTALIAGIVRGRGIQAEALSPTYPILHVYDAETPLYHFDWYRLEDAEEFTEAGLWDYFPGDGIALVEWPDRLPEIWPKSALHICLEALDDTTRRIIMTKGEPSC